MSNTDWVKQSLINTIVFSSDDWAETPAKAWVYGVVVGWDEESLAELWLKFSDWNLDTLDRLRALHKEFKGESNGTTTNLSERTEPRDVLQS